jgi:hypothetical protein
MTNKPLTAFAVVKFSNSGISTIVATGLKLGDALKTFQTLKRQFPRTDYRIERYWRKQ